MKYVCKNMEELAAYFYDCGIRRRVEAESGPAGPRSIKQAFLLGEATAFEGAAHVIRNAHIEPIQYNPDVLEPRKDRLHVLEEFHDAHE